MAVGDPLRRREDLRLVTGAGRFADDVGLPGELTMVVVRSPVAAGAIRAIDYDAARRLPGIAAVFTGAEVQADGVGVLRSPMTVARPDGSPMLDTPCQLLATEHVQFVGDPVAVVLAETRAAALDAAEAVVLDIADRPAVTDLRGAAAPDAPVVWPGAPDNVAFRYEAGDAAAVEAAFAAAERVIRVDLDITRVSANPIEPRGAVTDFDAASGRSTLWIGTQLPHGTGRALAALLNLDPEAIHLPGQDVGGSFGMRNTPSREAALAVWASRRLQRPVRWMSGRTEAFLSDNHGRDRFSAAELALDAEGGFLAVRANSLASMGGYIAPNGLISAIVHVGGLTGVYRIPAIHLTMTGVMSNNQPTSPYRGAGRPEATYTIERLIDVAAHETGIDRFELRRRNMLQPTDLPYKTPLGPVYDSGDFPAALAMAEQAADRGGFSIRRAASEAAGKLRGLGVAMSIEGAGGPYGKPNPEFAELRFDATGGLTLFVGSGDSGQGHRTTFAQLAGDLLGRGPATIRVETGDTDRVREGFGSVGSRTVLAAGTAVHRAANDLVEKGRTIAADYLEAAADDVEFTDGTYAVAGTDRQVSLADLAAAHHEQMHADALVAARDATFPNGCHICEVEIDPETGAVVLDRYVVVDDVGTVINPLLMKGQIHGGIAQGVGQALMERIVYDGVSGQMLTASFIDYAMPRADDLPPFDVRSNPVPSGNNPIGAKGAGEAGTVGALPAVVSAIADALGGHGVVHLDMPATPERVWRAIAKRHV